MVDFSRIMQERREARERAPADACVQQFAPGTRAEEKASQPPSNPIPQPAFLLGPDGPIAKSLPGYTPRPAQIQVSELVLRAFTEKRCAIIEAGTGTGKCVKRGTLIHLETGELVPIESLEGKRPWILSLSRDFGIVRQRAREVFSSGRKQLYRITTRHGREITASSDHRFLTIEGWKRLEELSLSDRIVAPRELPSSDCYVNVLDGLDEAEVSFLALVLADGSCSNDQCLSYTKLDPEMGKEFIRCCEQFENCTASEGKRQGRYNCRRIRVQGKNTAMQFLDAQGLLGKLSKQKTIPDSIFRLEDDFLAHFLGRLFSGDGCVESRGIVSYSTASELMSVQIQILLLRFGIICSRRYKRATAQGEEFDAWELLISSSEQISRFINLIGPNLIGEKRRSLDALAENLPKENPNNDLIPRQIESDLKRLAEARRLSWYQVRKDLKIKNKTEHGFSRKKLRALSEYLHAPHLEKFGKVLWDQVRSIEPAGEDDTWDITMEGEPNFLANGLVVHNSLAIGVPAVAWSRTLPTKEERAADPFGIQKKRVAIVTALKVLQTQYTNKDFPFLEKHLGIPFKFAQLKGRRNYLCEEAIDLIDRPDSPNWQEVANWSLKTKTGDLEELPFEIEPSLRSAITVDSDGCSGSKCDFFDRCHYYKSRRLAEEADVIIVNTTLFVLNQWLGGILLPRYDAAVIDEAHKLEGITRDVMETVISPVQIRDHLRKARPIIARQSYDAGLASIAAFGKAFSAAFRTQLPRKGQARIKGGDLPERLVKASENLAQVLFAVANELTAFAQADDYNKLSGLAASIADSLRLFTTIFKRALTTQTERSVMWLERNVTNGPLSIHVVPLEVGDWLRDNVFSVPTVLMSATLSTGGHDPFASIRTALGVPDPLELICDSPYSYTDQARYLLPRWPFLKKPPKGKNHEESSQLWCDELFGPTWSVMSSLVDGRTLFLCTSRAVMQEMHARITAAAPEHWTILSQDSAPKGELIRRFKESDHPVLFAIKSFFEGVDIPGGVLSCVIIDRIPFPLASDPVEQALRERHGGFPQCLDTYDIPKAIIDLRQAVGRLIRTESDRGLILLCDPRLRHAKYRSKILEQLPGFVEPLDGSQMGKVKPWINGTGPAPEYGVPF